MISTCPFKTTLSPLLESPQTTSPEILGKLISVVRPKRAQDIASATHALRALCFFLEHHPQYCLGLSQYLMRLLESRLHTHLYTDVGILSGLGMWDAFWQRLGEKILPARYQDNYLKDVLGVIFPQADDAFWVSQIDDVVWLDLYQLLKLKQHDRGLRHCQLQQIEAAQVLSYRICAIGLEPELIRNHPAIEQFESPFLTHNSALRDYLEAFKTAIVQGRELQDDDKQVCILLDQCSEIVEKVRKNALQDGVSISLTYLLVRLDQHLGRLRTLLDLLNPEQPQAVKGIQLFKQLVSFDARKHSLSDLWASNTELLALQITEHAGRTGEHYVASNRSEWLNMARSAMGAGFIVGFMALAKILLAKLKLAPLIEAMAFSLNYSLGFMLIHVLHYTVATKQPAMTAARIAASIEKLDGHERLDRIAELIESVARTQFIAILGNVALAIPTSFAIALIAKHGFAMDFVGPEKAQLLLQDLDPIHSLALFHAAIAGVCLFLAGLISGYYDNKAAYQQIPARLLQLKLPRRLLGETRWARVCHYIENNLGALAGNFFFGIMLGTIATLGYLLGLPIDIRHITFSSANLAYAATALDFQLSWQTWSLSCLGIILIGLINLAVSFALALWVALRSRKIRVLDKGAIIHRVVGRFMRAPQRFFAPPRG